MASDEETRLMSRMLTQGATMLGEHCDGCGNPLFRVDDDVVCAVCSADGGEDPKSKPAHEKQRQTEEPGDSEATKGSPDVDEATAEVRRNLTRVVQRLSEDVSEEQDVSRLNRQLDALQKAVDLLERL